MCLLKTTMVSRSLVGAVHVDGDRHLELKVMAPAGGAGLADVEGPGVVCLEPRVAVLGARGRSLADVCVLGLAG